MQVETYEMTEVVDQNIQENEECLGLIESLGLSGQQSLINPNKTTFFPYRKMTKEEKIVYETMLPASCALEEFKEGQIPLRVLQVASHAKSLDFFDKGLIVFHSKNADVKDPVLVGRHCNDKQYSWSYDQYILARWGEVLLPFAECTEIAMKIIRVKLQSGILKAEATIRQFKEILQSATPEMLLMNEDNHNLISESISLR
jgi:hypothetical protein